MDGRGTGTGRFILAVIRDITEDQPRVDLADLARAAARYTMPAAARSRPTARPAVARTGITPLLAGPTPRDACRMQMFRYHGTVSGTDRVTLADEPTQIEAATQDGGQDLWALGR